MFAADQGFDSSGGKLISSCLNRCIRHITERLYTPGPWLHCSTNLYKYALTPLIRATGGTAMTICEIQNAQKTPICKQRIIECRSGGKRVKEWCKEALL